MKKYSEQQINELKALPPCKVCGQKLKLHECLLGVYYIQVYHKCTDEVTDTVVNLQGSFNYLVESWRAINPTCFVVELEADVYLSDWQRNPPRAYVLSAAAFFETKKQALEALEKVRKAYPRKGYKQARVIEVLKNILEVQA
jgi:hypothetical protein